MINQPKTGFPKKWEYMSNGLIVPFVPEYIYTICCPYNGFVVYVGKTFNFSERFYCHRHAKSTVGFWIRAMISIGKTPIFNVIDVTYGWGGTLEKHYIEYYKGLNQATFNKENYWSRSNTLKRRALIGNPKAKP
jgi:hypothetical protein